MLLFVLQTHFEPWFISGREGTEWFDIRYRGYGKNKIQQVGTLYFWVRW